MSILEKGKAIFAIDVIGESTNNTIVGCELRLNIDSKVLMFLIGFVEQNGIKNLSTK